MDARTIEGALTGRFGRPLRFFEEIASTQTEAMRWAAEGAAEGALVATDHQTAGRARWGRTWLSAPGKLLQFSLILRPELSLDRLGLLTVGLGLAIAEGLDAATGLDTTLKWPNDINIGGRKVTGILVESRLSGAALDAVVAGIGINVAWRPDELPEDIAARATSVGYEMERRHLGERPPRAVLLAAVLAAAESVYDEIRGDRSVDHVLNRASARSDVLGRTVTVRFADGGVIEGRALRLTATGALEIAVDGARRAIEAGEIEQIRPSDDR